MRLIEPEDKPVLEIKDLREQLGKAQGILDDLEDYEYDIRASLSVADAALNINNAIARLDYLEQIEGKNDGTVD